MKRLIRLVLTLTGFVFALLVVAVSIIASESGSRWLVQRIIDHNDIPVTFQSMDGRLLDRIYIQELHYTGEQGLAISIASLDLDWSPTELIKRRVHINRIDINRLAIQPPTTEDSTASPLPAVELPALPLTVQIDSIVLAHTRLANPETEQSVKRIEASLLVNDTGATVENIVIVVADVSITGTAGISAGKHPVLSSQLAWQGRVQEQPTTGTLQLNGPAEKLAVELDASAQADLQARGSLNLTGDQPTYRFQGSLNGTTPSVLEGMLEWSEALQFSINGDLEFLESGIHAGLTTPKGEKLQLRLQADVALPASRPDAGANATFEWSLQSELTDSLYNLGGNGDIDYVDETLAIQHDLTTPVVVKLDGNIDFANELSMDVRLDWQSIEWPLDNDSRLQLSSGYIDLDGSLSALVITAATEFAQHKVAADTEKTTEHLKYRINLDSEMNLAESHPTGRIRGQVDGPLPIVLADYLQQPSPITFDTVIGKDSADISLSGAATTIDGTPVELAIDGTADFPRPDSPLTVQMRWQFDPEKTTGNLAQYRGEANLQWREQRLDVSHTLATPFPSQMVGNIDFSNDVPAFDVVLDWDDLVLTLADTPPLTSKHGNVRIDGPLSGLNVIAQTNFESTPAGPFNLSLRAVWSEPELTVRELSVQALDGQINSQGILTAGDVPKAALELQARNINLAYLYAELDSNFDADAKLDLNVMNDQVNGSADISSLTGEWRGYPLRGQARLSRSDELLQIESLNLMTGDNRIDVQLKTAKKLSGHVDLELSDMSVFSPDLGGNINGRIDISGTAKTPVFLGKFEGSDIFALDWRIASIRADAEVDTGAGGRSMLAIETGTLQYENLIQDRLSVNVNGLTESHTIDISTIGSSLSVNTTLEGSLREHIWRSTLQEFIIKSADAGTWTLTGTPDMKWDHDNQHIELDNTCLGQSTAQMCIKAEGTPGRSMLASATLDRLPLTLAGPWLPDTLSAGGTISGDITGRQADHRWQVDGNITGADNRLTVGLGDDAQTLEVPRLSLQARATPQQRQVNLNLASPGNFEVILDGTLDNAGQQPLSARLDITLQQLEWLARIEPALTGSKGRFHMLGMANGTLDSPEIQADFDLQQGQIIVSPIGLKIDSLVGKVRSTDIPQQLHVTTTMSSKGKELVMVGDISVSPDKNYPYELTLTGQDFPAVRTADMSLDASPDLKLYGSTALHHVRGIIHIPKLDLLVTSLPEDSVSVSPDTVVVQSKQAGARIVETGNGNDFIRNQVDLDITVSLGPEINIQGFGLNTGLAGDIKVIKPAGVYQPRGEGFVNLTDGSYRAYGQNLVIEKGQLQFAGPLDNPGVLVRAYRPDLPVRAGVRVDGNVREPRLTLYSEPPQTDADTLSYIITGGPIRGASNDEANLLAQAALSLGAQESSILTNEIESMFSLDEFTVGAGNTVDSASLSAAKRISPNLTFRSSFNPFKQLWSFLVNYRLTDHWSVQTESGESQGADIIYSIETNKMSDLFRKFWSFE